MTKKEGLVRLRLNVRGSVQGVGFRYRARHAAQMLGVTGWVRNEDDGSVSMELQGTAEQISRVMEMIGRGMFVSIDAIDRKTIPVREEERDFVTADDRW